MSVYYLCNVGLRDLALDGDTDKLQPPRIKGQEVLKGFGAYESRFSAPIISPGVEFALKRSLSIDRMVLIATDQSDDVAEAYRSRDTVFTADVLKKHLEFKYGRKKIKEIKVLTVRGANPAQYDEMYRWFQRIANSKDLPAEGLECCYLSPSGGTPQANFALMLHAIRAFGDKCEVLAIDPETNTVQPLNIAADLQNASRREIVLNHLTTYSFAEALDVLERMAAPALARSLADYAKHRLYFDFERAKEIAIEAARTATGQERKLCSDLRAEVEEIENSGLEALIVELFQNAAITFANQQYVDFLGRCFRFQEATLQLVNVRIYGLLLDGDTIPYVKKLTALVESTPALKAFFADPNPRYGGTLNYDRINTSVMRKLADYACAPGFGKREDEVPFLSGELQKTYGRIAEVMARIGQLSQLRNHAIIAHGFNGVSEKILLEKYNQGSSLQNNPVEDMGLVLDALGMPKGESPFEKVAGKISQLLERQ